MWVKQLLEILFLIKSMFKIENASLIKIKCTFLLQWALMDVVMNFQIQEEVGKFLSS
jgi:hypothetical protein